MLICDLKSRADKYRTEISRALSRVIESGWYVLGPEVTHFEAAFAEYIGVENCCAVGNGTDALELALRAIGVQRSDQVATVANAGMYTTTALLAIGAEPYYIDVDLDSRVTTLAEVERALAHGTKAVVVTHLYGRAIPQIAEIAACCREANIPLVEDCAQAHGATIGNRRVGSFGDCGCFSFYPTKNLGALGDGGAVVSNDPSLIEKMVHLRQYGWTSKYQVELGGGRNSRLDEIQAALLSEFLPHLDDWNARRCEIATLYSRLIIHPEVMVPPVSGNNYVAHLYVIRSTRRDELRDYLRSQEISSDVHYPIPDYKQPLFGDRFADVYLPNTEQLAREILTLPCYPEMTIEDVQRVIATVNAWPV